MPARSHQEIWESSARELNLQEGSRGILRCTTCNVLAKCCCEPTERSAATSGHRRARMQPTTAIRRCAWYVCVLKRDLSPKPGARADRGGANYVRGFPWLQSGSCCCICFCFASSFLESRPQGPEGPLHPEAKSPSLILPACLSAPFSFH